MKTVPDAVRYYFGRACSEANVTWTALPNPVDYGLTYRFTNQGRKLVVVDFHRRYYLEPGESITINAGYDDEIPKIFSLNNGLPNES